jgi:hypothetical protein
MRPRACIGFLSAACLLVPLMLAADAPAPTPTPAPVRPMVLKDGRVLHNARVMTDEGASVFIHADEGLLQVLKSNLPPGVADVVPQKAPDPSAPEYVMERFDPNQGPAILPPEPGAKPKAKAAAATPPPKAVAEPVYKGCTIMSFQKKSFENVLGNAEVVIQNDSEYPVQIRAVDFVCIAANGTRHPGRNLFANTFPPSVKRREFVPAHGQLDDIVSFGNDDLDIASVQWAR